jgi:D-serine deaminase-like pyridoxal phosphate-dependent protein
MGHQLLEFAGIQLFPQHCVNTAGCAERSERELRRKLLMKNADKPVH